MKSNLYSFILFFISFLTQSSEVNFQQEEKNVIWQIIAKELTLEREREKKDGYLENKAKLEIQRSLHDKFLEAVYGKNFELAKKYLNQGVNIDFKFDVYSWTALIKISASKSSWESVKDIFEFLVKEGANINAKGNDGRTSLMWAAVTGNKDIIKFLIENGSNVNDQEYRDGWTALTFADLNNHKEIVKLLIQNGANSTYKYVKTYPKFKIQKM